MKTPRYPHVFTLSLLALLASMTTVVRAQPADWKEWRPVTKEELAQTASKIDAEANAEILFADTYIEDSFGKLESYRYMRIKVFNERGAQQEGTAVIPYDRKEEISEITARTIKPDGEIVPFSVHEIRDRELIRVGKRQRRMKSFALPAVVPGAVIEYRWKMVVKGSSLVAERALPLQFSLPAQRIRYRYRPIRELESYLRFIGLQVDSALDFIPDKDRVYSFEQLNKPGYHEEPQSLPERNVHSWAYVNYDLIRATNPKAYWRLMGDSLFPYLKKRITPNGELKKKVEEVVGDARDPRQKFERLVEYTRTRIRVAEEDRAALLEQQQEAQELRSPTDLLKQGYGSRENVATLLVAMAKAAGLEANIAYLPNQREFLNGGAVLSELIFYVTVPGVVVFLDGKPVFYYPTARKWPTGMVPAIHTGDESLVLEDGNTRMIRIAEPPPTQSRRVTRADLRLSAEGALTGQVSYRLTGYAAAEFLDRLKDKTSSEQEELVTDQIQARLPGANVTNLKLLAEEDLTGEIGYSYEVEIPSYAQRTGRRLFFLPAFTQKGIRPVFESTVRHNHLLFNFTYQDSAEVTIELPRGYEIESAEAPQPFTRPNFGVGYDATFTVTMSDERKSLVAKREFTFNRVYLPREYYGDLKKIMDFVHLMDNQMLTLRRE